MTELTMERAIEAVKQVKDPELGIDLWTLGLIYELKVEGDNHVVVKMTLTSPMCPFGDMLVERVRAGLEAVGFVPEVELVFDPPWEPSDEVKMELGLS